MPRRPAGPLTEFSSDRRQLLDDPRSAAEEPMVCMTLCWREMDSNYRFRATLGVSRVSQMRDPGRGNGRIGVRFDSLREGTGFEFRLTGFGSANFRSLSRWRASNAYQDVVI